MRRLACLILLSLITASDGAGQSKAGVPSSSAVGGALRPGDIIRLKIWRETDLSGDFSVAEDGQAVLPKIGTVHVGGMSGDSLTRFLRASYERYLRNPTIEVVVLRRITVSGAVNKPGLYPVDGTMTVADALALAGGATPDGHSDRVDLIREGQRLKIKLTPNSRLSDTPLTSGDQLSVPMRSWLSRNVSLVVSGTAAVAGLLVALTVR
jgi:polysaccharide export outer membrane protein